jgi:hypothetical protein
VRSPRWVNVHGDCCQDEVHHGSTGFEKCYEGSGLRTRHFTVSDMPCRCKRPMTLLSHVLKHNPTDMPTPRLYTQNSDHGNVSLSQLLNSCTRKILVASSNSKWLYTTTR